MAATVTVPTWLAVAVLGALVIMTFMAGRRSKEPDGKRLEDLANGTKKWLQVADKVAGTKAAVYGGVGVILGAGAGLTADFVKTGEISLIQVGRGLLVLAVLAVLTVVIVRVVEKLIRVPEDSEGDLPVRAAADVPK